MIGRLSLALVAIVAGVLVASSGSMAATAGSLGALKDVGGAQSNVQKTWGWHRTCQRGWNGWHKHVPGVGRVQCTARKCFRNSAGRLKCRWF